MHLHSVVLLLVLGFTSMVDGITCKNDNDVQNGNADTRYRIALAGMNMITDLFHPGHGDYFYMPASAAGFPYWITYYMGPSRVTFRKWQDERDLPVAQLDIGELIDVVSVLSTSCVHGEQYVGLGWGFFTYDDGAGVSRLDADATDWENGVEIYNGSHLVQEFSTNRDAPKMFNWSLTYRTDHLSARARDEPFPALHQGLEHIWLAVNLVGIFYRSLSGGPGNWHGQQVPGIDMNNAHVVATFQTLALDIRAQMENRENTGPANVRDVIRSRQLNGDEQMEYEMVAEYGGSITGWLDVLNLLGPTRNAQRLTMDDIVGRLFQNMVNVNGRLMSRYVWIVRTSDGQNAINIIPVGSQPPYDIGAWVQFRVVRNPRGMRG